MIEFSAALLAAYAGQSLWKPVSAFRVRLPRPLDMKIMRGLGDLESKGAKAWATWAEPATLVAIADMMVE